MQNKVCFEILDIDRDGLLNVVNLLHLNKNLPKNSTIGREILKVINFLLERNLYSKSLMTRVEINLEVFLKIVNSRTCLLAEIRRVFLGIQGSLREMKESGKLLAKADSDDEEFDDGQGSIKKSKKYGSFQANRQ